MNILRKIQPGKLLREYEDNYYDRIRVYRSRKVTDVESAVSFAAALCEIPDLKIDHILFENLQLREEESALPEEESGDISDALLASYIRASATDRIMFVGSYHEKPVEIGIDKREPEVWLRILHLTEEELTELEKVSGIL